MVHEDRYIHMYTNIDQQRNDLPENALTAAFELEHRRQYLEMRLALVEGVDQHELLLYTLGSPLEAGCIGHNCINPR